MEDNIRIDDEEVWFGDEFALAVEKRNERDRSRDSKELHSHLHLHLAHMHWHLEH